MYVQVRAASAPGKNTHMSGRNEVAHSTVVSRANCGDSLMNHSRNIISHHVVVDDQIARCSTRRQDLSLYLPPDDVANNRSAIAMESA